MLFCCMFNRRRHERSGERNENIAKTEGIYYEMGPNNFFLLPNYTMRIKKT